MLLLIFVVFLCGFCMSDDSDLGYDLAIGNAVDIFANYGDLSQVMQVISGAYEDDDEESDQESTEIFNEKNIRIFSNFTSEEHEGSPNMNLQIILCDTFDHLLNSYFKHFQIEGTDRPWKAFLGDWTMFEITRTLGLPFHGFPFSDYRDSIHDCCYVIVKMIRARKSVKIKNLNADNVKDYVLNATESLDIEDVGDIKRFMRSYGTHYIESYVTGNFAYQIFKYKKPEYNTFKAYVRTHRNSKTGNLRMFFSSYFLETIGDVKVASGNITVETWAKDNLRDSQYRFSRPSLLKLHYNPTLSHKLEKLLDDTALLGLSLKTIKPVFKEKYKGEKFTEIVENELRLWEINS